MFVLTFFGHVGKWLDKKAKVNFKLCDVRNWETKITMHILPTISRSIDSQIFKFGQLIEYNRRNIIHKM